jgi:hypothetical protein
VRVFVNAGRDRAWAEWIAWQLDRSGYAVELDCWDWQIGEEFVARMNAALAAADCMLAVFSEGYFEPERWTSNEWQAAVRAGKQKPRFLVPVRIDDTPAPPLLDGLIAVDLQGRSAVDARQALIDAVAPVGRPDREPRFPGISEPGRSGRGPVRRTAVAGEVARRVGRRAASQ